MSELPSRRLLQGKDRAAARAMLKGIGFDDRALSQPQVMVSHSWIETMPCNYNQRDLAAAVKEGVRAAGGTPMEVNTIAISDGVTMGTEGMKTSLVSRELIADSIDIPHYATGEPVLAIQEDNSGLLWWGTIHGLFCKDRNKATIKHFVHDPLDPKSLSDDFIETIYPDNQGKIWIGTQDGGLNVFDPKTQDFTSYRNNVANKNSLSDNPVYALYRDEGKTLWIGTQEGLDQMNIETGDFIHYRHDPGDTNSLGITGVTCIQKDGEIRLWVGCWRWRIATTEPANREV